MAAPAYGTSGTWAGGSGTTRSYAVPASVANNDVIVIPMFIDGSTVTISAMPTGFAHAPNSPRTVNAGGGGNHTVNVVWKRATAGDTGTYDFTFSASAYVEGQAHRYTGCITTGSPWDVTTAADGGSTNSSTTPAVSLTTTGPDELLFFAATNWAGGGWTPPTGFTERTDNGSDVTAADLVQTAAGGTGSLQATCTGSDKTGAWLGALIGTTVAGSIPYTPPRAPQFRDAGEAWWIQRDLRDANTVGAAANPLPSPLDSAWQAGARYWHLYADTADAAPRTWQSLQRMYVSDPSLLAPAASPPYAATRTAAPRDPGETWWQQRPARDPAALGQPLLENELLGGGDTARHYLVAATHDDRRQVPQQRAYVSDPSFYPLVPPTDPLTLAFGAGGSYWWLYNTAAAQVDRREVPQQRRYICDPALLASALLEDVLLGGADDRLRHYLVAAYGPRPVVVLQRTVTDQAAFAPLADPLLVGSGVGGDTWRRYATPVTHDDRRETAWQPSRWTLYTTPRPITVPGSLTSTTSSSTLGPATTSPRLAPTTSGGDA